MPKEKIYLASDNFAPAHPLIINAISEANSGFAPAYGSDSWSEKAEMLIQTAFNRTCKVVFVPSGTGANVLGLKLSCQRYQSVICTDIAHLQYQESGAAESIVGCKLLTIPHEEGKATPETILKKLKSERAFGRHSTSPRVLSITQPTEVGTVYSIEELRALSELCIAEKLLLHMDGARFFNAIVHLGTTFEKMTAGVDFLSLGGTKNGLLGAEALLIFNPSVQEGWDYLQKQTLQLVSKMRYLSAQFIPFLEKNLWETLASQSNHKAQEIASLIKRSPHLDISYPVQTNQIFFTAPASWIPIIQEKIYCYLWNEDKSEVRFIASWCTSKSDIDNLRELLETLHA